MTKVTADEANAFLQGAFGDERQTAQTIMEMETDRCVMRIECGPEQKRPGGEAGYISGPTQMSMADSAAYFALFTRIGIVPMALTSNLNINFLRPCIGDALIGEAKVMKLGKALAIMEVEMRAEGAKKASSHAIVTYALPREG